MIKIEIDYAQYSLLIQSLLSERQNCKNILKGECKGSLVYDIYENTIKSIDAFLIKLRNCE